MPITTNDFPALTDDLESIFNVTAKTKIGDMVSNQLFDIREVARRTWDHLILHGVSGVIEVTPCQDLPTINADEGDSITYTQKYYGANFEVTKAMRKFDLFDQIFSLAKSTATDAFDKIDQALADVLLNGFATTAYTDVFDSSITPTGPNALALFSATQTFGLATQSATFRNLIRNDAGQTNPVLDRAAIIKARVDAATHQDGAGLTRPINLDTLIVAPQNHDLAMRIVNSGGVSGTPNVDLNPLQNVVKVVQWERLQTSGQGTDTSAFWFMADSRQVKESLKGFFAEKPSLDAPEQVYRNKNWQYSVDFFFTYGFGYQAYIWGSQGTQA